MIMRKKETTFLSSLYEFWSPYIGEGEYFFYHKLLQGALKNGGKALELSCGSGRLLLPFVKEGFLVEGIEGSKELYVLLKDRAQEYKLKVDIYQMDLADCSIKSGYKMIYSSLGSFQMISHWEDAEILLNKIYQALDDEGVLSIALFLPWGWPSFANNNWVIASDIKDKETKHRYIRREKSSYEDVDQIINGKVRYETWLGRDLLEMEERDLNIRWYSQNEFRLMLKGAGFSDIEIHRSYREDGDQMRSFMHFLARK